MTDVSKDKNTIIKTEKEARGLYVPSPKEFTGKVGIEVEMWLYKQGIDKPEIPEAATMQLIQNELKTKGYDAQLEAAGVLEYASQPSDLKDVAELVQKVNVDLKEFEYAASRHGYKRAVCSILPTVTTDEAWEHRVSRERLELAISHVKKTYNQHALNIPLLTTGVQTSFSPSNENEMFKMMYRASALTPLLIASMNSSTGFAENKNERMNFHPRSKYYESYGKFGGLSEAFLKASSGKELIKNHINEVFDRHMFFAYDHEGKPIKQKGKKPLTFRSLIAEGLNTQSNYELAETFFYNDLKICNLRDEAGQTVGKRLEVRAADSGKHQASSTLLLTAALVPEGKSAMAFEKLLHAYGFKGDPKQDAELLASSRKAAVDHHGKFMDVSFGTGKLRDFAKDVADIIIDHYKENKNIAKEVLKLTDILVTGNCDAKIFASKYKTLQDVNNDLQRGGMSKPANRVEEIRIGL